MALKDHSEVRIFKAGSYRNRVPKVESPASIGHDLDDDTIYLYRMDEAESGDYANIADSSGNGRDFAVTGLVDIIPGPDGVGLARWFPGSTGSYASQPGSADAMALFTGGDWTMEGWYYVPTAAPSAFIWHYGAGGESQATNYICSVMVSAIGEVVLFMEGVGSGDIILIATATLIPYDEWAHVAVSREFNGADYDYHFYINGVFTETITGAGATGGSSGTFYIGKGSAGSPYTGALGSHRWSSVARPEAEIAASFAREGKDHELDADTYMLIGMTEEPDLRDATNTNHMRLSGGSRQSVASLIGGDGNALLFDGSTRYSAASGPASDAFRTALADEITLEFWGQIDWAAVDGYGAWCFGSPGSESATLNFFSLDVSSGRKGTIFSEHGSGLDSIFTTVADLFAVESVAEIHHFAITKRNVGGFAVYEIYIDGALIEESDGTHVVFDGGANSVLHIGSGLGDAINRWIGTIDDLRVSSKRRSAAEIAASFLARAQ